MSVNKVKGEEKLQKSDFPLNYSKGKRSGNRKRGNGKETIFTGFNNYRMDDKQQGLISELKDFQMGCSWVPPTPAKPGLTTQQPICTEWQDNQAFQANWLESRKFSQVNQIGQAEFDLTRVSEGFMQEPPDPYIAGCCDSTIAVNMHGGFDIEEASVAGFQVNKDDFCFYKFISDEDMWSNASFGELLARAHAAGTTAAGNASSQTAYTPTSSSFVQNFCTEIDGRQYTTTSENSSFGNFTVESNNSMPNISTGGPCTHSMPIFDLNLPSIPTGESLDEVFSFQFAPITPEKTTRADDRHQLGMPNLSMNEMLGIKDLQLKETSIERVELEGIHQNKEQSNLVVDKLCENMSTQLEENNKPDKGGTGDVDLIKTPQRKPRRKKHRPKVIIEDQSQITPKPRVERPSDPQETTKGKRKYVKRKGVDNPTEATPFGREINGSNIITKSSSAKETTNGKRKYVRRGGVNKPAANSLDQDSCETTDPKTVRQTRYSCRRSLKFDFEGQVRDESNSDMEPQAQNFKAKDQSGSTMQLGSEATMKKTEVSIAYDLARPMKQVIKCYPSNLEGHYSSSSPHSKTNTLHDKLTLMDQKTCITGKCQIVFSDFTHDKEGNTVQVNSDAQLTQKSPSDSDYSSSTWLIQERDLKRQHKGTTVVAEFGRSNSTETFHNSLQAYSAIFRQNAYNYDRTPGISFPAMTKRIEKGLDSAISSTNTVIALENHAIAPLDYTQNEQQNIGFLSTLGPTERLEKKRSNETDSVSNLGSLLEMCKQVLGSPGPGATTFKTFYASAKMAKKKRSKRKLNNNSTLKNIHSHHKLVTRSMGSPLAKTWMCRSPVDSLIEQCNRLDLNAVSSLDAAIEHNTVMAYNMNYEEQYALVPYQRSEALVPFDSSFYLGKRRRPRPKVDLDDETNRVWKLLLENINSEGIDGTDEENEKWWEEERRVFRGRADSFIARMHLVQGDRRFSPWKGSVLDSVIGVFLTQNVSDHLSSSAFMSLAARFPSEPESDLGQSYQDVVRITAKEPEVCDLDPDDTIGWNEVLNQPTCSKDSKMFLLDSDYDDIREVVDSVKSSGNSFDGISKDKSGQLSGLCTNGPDASLESTVNKSTGFVGDERDLDDTLSSLSSVIYSRNSADSVIDLTSERTESCSLSTLEAEPPAGTDPNTNSIICSTSCVKLSRMERTILHGDNKRRDENNLSNMDRQIESVSMVHDTQNQNENLSDNTCSKPAMRLTPTSGAQEAGHFDRPQKNGESSNIANEKELFETELSGSSAESATQTTLQKFLAISRETPKPYNEKGHSSNHLADMYPEIAENPTGKLESQFQFEENNYKRQEVSNIPILRQNFTDITDSSNIDNSRTFENKEVDSNLKDPGKIVIERKAKKGKFRKERHNPVDWDRLRKQAQEGGTRRERTANTMDSVDWDAVRCADVNEIAQTIKERGMNNMLAERIKDFLNRLVRDHGSIDLEWLRDIPPDKAKEYLLSVRGLGLKSVECVRLLTLHHLAFPVDTNVGRIAVRLGWVPLQPLPESLQLHLLELYPVLESIQKYLWPRLCKLDQRTLYELHYQMITFGKVFCTKSKPNCNACPMRGECRHFASAFASARLALPAPEEKSVVSAIENNSSDQNAVKIINSLWLPLPHQLEAHNKVSNSEPIIEVPATPEPFVEVPPTPEPGSTQIPECDIEDNVEDSDDIPAIQLNMEGLTQNLQEIMQKQMELQESDMSKALVALTPEAASIPMPKLKNVNRLRTEHQVYELPDSHPLLQKMDKREPDDPCSYLLAIWTPGETVDSIQPAERHCSSQESGNLCTDETCFSCNSIREGNSQTVRGTLLIPCRTAMRGSFPLNGTYFQVNEVFADHESSVNPINIPREWLWNLPRRMVYFGTSIPTIFKGLTTEGIQYCFWRGFVCVRGFDQKTRAPRPLIARLHFPVSKLTKVK
ncbi:ROS1-like isoform X1 [Olea europaea subsp. europaea]|uniref:ROS1-like isoform X1 n=3 Tax=Olea europaea subsp. europaea TaxID=158383 RepID=A0A8S0Q114_OLEEU|nr:ROS1-like isoform X1 [Olea europaea subsp. europaea]